MDKSWIRFTLCLAFLLLAVLKGHELRAISSFYMPSKAFKLKTFAIASTQIEKGNLEALGIWESILTGKSKFLSPQTKEKYQKLGLLHLFTPSGFHLSALMFPLMSVIHSQRFRLLTLLSLGLGLFFAPGLGALKRMLMIKVEQNIFGQKAGFILGLITDMLFGSFQKSALGFSYSFLFLSIIYSKVRGPALVIWFFIGQIIITFFQGGSISPLLLILSPIINFLYGLLLPVLFICSYPMQEFQLLVGVSLIRLISLPVNIAYFIISNAPSIEVNFLTLVLILLFMSRKWKIFIISLCLYTGNLNLNYERSPSIGSNEFVSKGTIIKRVYEEKKVRIYFTDGRCDLKLIRGFWWENCSPRKRSS